MRRDRILPGSAIWRPPRLVENGLYFLIRTAALKRIISTGLPHTPKEVSRSSGDPFSFLPGQVRWKQLFKVCWAIHFSRANRARAMSLAAFFGDATTHSSFFAIWLCDVIFFSSSQASRNGYTPTRKMNGFLAWTRAESLAGTILNSLCVVRKGNPGGLTRGCLRAMGAGARGNSC